ncbi:MAG: MBL fold metallo-hydrolase [Ignavibacteriales bacterium]|jgi:glyoxylase-like metal-dependent hydrolase (beta-lactamase superfamily II)|nr:MAG: MBL fold metallo-hydrolase [Ignavibacteriales bacterium]
MLKIGKYSIEEIKTGTFALDGGAMFGIIPKPLWDKTNPADDQNRIKLGARCLLLKSDSKKILIETGIGTGWDEKFKKIYDLDQSENDLYQSLKKKGIVPSDITDVILTHLHFDHVGGAVLQENSKFIPAFPNAKYHVQKEHFEYSLNSSDKDRGSFIKDRFLPLMEEGVLNTIDIDQFDDEISFIKVYGHTIAQQLVKMSDGNQTYLYVADLVPFYSQIPIVYLMGYDIQPLKTIEQKKKYLSLAVEEDWKLIFGHDPNIAMATVQKTDKGFTHKELFNEIK